MSMSEGVGEFSLEVRRNRPTFAKYLNIRVDQKNSKIVYKKKKDKLSYL
jgi:hypothetical protein